MVRDDDDDDERKKRHKNRKKIYFYENGMFMMGIMAYDACELI